jgi:hypothetical protein
VRPAAAHCSPYAGAQAARLATGCAGGQRPLHAHGGGGPPRRRPWIHPLRPANHSTVVPALIGRAIPAPELAGSASTPPPDALGHEQEHLPACALASSSSGVRASGQARGLVPGFAPWQSSSLLRRRLPVLADLWGVEAGPRGREAEEEREERWACGGTRSAPGRVLARAATPSDTFFSLILSLSYVVACRELVDIHCWCPKTDSNSFLHLQLV